VFTRIVVLALCVFGFAATANAQERPQFRLFAIRQGGKWGFIDRSGKVVVKPGFDEVGARSEGTWAVRCGQKWGFVAEASGRLSVTPRYEAVAAFSEGLCAVVIGGKIGFVGKNGVFQIPPRFVTDRYSTEFRLWALRYHFSHGLSPAEISEHEASRHGFKGTWGFIDRRGAWKIVPRFRHAEIMSDGMAQVTLEDGGRGQDGYVSQGGKFVPLPEGASGLYSEPFYEGLAAVPTIKGVSSGFRFGFLDKEGHWAIEPRFSAVLPGSDPIENRVGFKDGIATVLVGTSRNDVRLGWIGKDGQWAIKPRFNGGGIGFMMDVAPARTGQKAGLGLGGFIDKTGQFVIDPEYEKLGVFTDILAPVQRPGEKWGYIDITGAIVITPRFDYIPAEKAITPDMVALQFRDGLAYVAQGNIKGYIDTDGHWIWTERQG
jgi:hypothetical protein